MRNFQWPLYPICPIAISDEHNEQSGREFLDKYGREKALRMIRAHLPDFDPFKPDWRRLQNYIEARIHFQLIWVHKLPDWLDFLQAIPPLEVQAKPQVGEGDIPPSGKTIVKRSCPTPEYCPPWNQKPSLIEQLSKLLEVCKDIDNGVEISEDIVLLCEFAYGDVKIQEIVTYDDGSYVLRSSAKGEEIVGKKDFPIKKDGDITPLEMPGKPKLSKALQNVQTEALKLFRIFGKYHIDNRVTPPTKEYSWDLPDPPPDTLNLRRKLKICLEYALPKASPNVQIYPADIQPAQIDVGSQQVENPHAKVNISTTKLIQLVGKWTYPSAWEMAIDLWKRYQENIRLRDQAAKLAAREPFVTGCANLSKAELETALQEHKKDNPNYELEKSLCAEEREEAEFQAGLCEREHKALVELSNEFVEIRFELKKQAPHLLPEVPHCNFLTAKGLSAIKPDEFAARMVKVEAGLLIQQKERSAQPTPVDAGMVKPVNIVSEFVECARTYPKYYVGLRTHGSKNKSPDLPPIHGDLYARGKRGAVTMRADRYSDPEHLIVFWGDSHKGINALCKMFEQAGANSSVLLLAPPKGMGSAGVKMINQISCWTADLFDALRRQHDKRLVVKDGWQIIDGNAFAVSAEVMQRAAGAQPVQPKESSSSPIPTESENLIYTWPTMPIKNLAILCGYICDPRTFHQKAIKAGWNPTRESKGEWYLKTPSQYVLKVFTANYKKEKYAKEQNKHPTALTAK